MRIQFTRKQINPFSVMDCKSEETGKGYRNEENFNN